VKVQWSNRALQDLEDLLEFIDMDNPAAAQRLHDRVFRKTDYLKALPEVGPISLEGGEPFREILVKPLRILYLIEGTTVTILAIYREEASLRSLTGP